MKNKEEKSYIYKIISPDTEKCYVGSTKYTLTQRMELHLRQFKKYSESNTKVDGLCSSIEIMKFRDVSIVLVETLINASKRCLLKREAYHIKMTPNCVNKYVPHDEEMDYVNCICGGSVQKTRHGIKQHIDGNRHKRYMIKNCFQVQSIDGLTKMDYHDYENKYKRIEI